MQKILQAEQVAAFYHDEFVASQMQNFQSLVVDREIPARVVVDIGGGVGHFAVALSKSLPTADVRVIDMDPVSVERCRLHRVHATLGDALMPQPHGDEDIVCFNLILHHLVGKTESATLAMQSKALSSWHSRASAVFVDEYIYDSYFKDISGKLIYLITRNWILSAFGKFISKFVPSLNANTFGIGVRFRSENEWRSIFANLNYSVDGAMRGGEETVSFARRLLLIRSCRRDSYLLKPRSLCAE